MEDLTRPIKMESQPSKERVNWIQMGSRLIYAFEIVTMDAGSHDDLQKGSMSTKVEQVTIWGIHQHSDWKKGLSTMKMRRVLTFLVVPPGLESKQIAMNKHTLNFF